MGVASELAVKFTADTSGLEAGGQKAEGLIGRMTSGLGKLGLAGMGVGAITGAVGSVVGSFGEMISASESTADAYGRLESVLGAKGMDAVSDAALDNANALGLSNQAFAEATGAAANYLVNLGLGKDAATDMAIGMTELAPKLAAFANADPSAVTDALQKGIGGSTRGLKELGIAIDDDLLKGLDDAAKGQAIYDQILAQSTGAVQAWGDNQGDVANSMARVTASMDDAKAAIGDKLLPIIAPLVEQFASALPGAIDVVVTAVGTVMDWFSQAGQTLSSFFSSTGVTSQTFRDTLLDVWEKIKSAVSAVVDWFNANVKPILVGVFETVAAKLAELKQQFDDKFGGIQGFVKSVVDWFNTNVAPTLAAVFDNVMSVIGPVVAFIRDHMDQIKAIVGGALDVVIGTVKVAFNILKGVFEVVMAAIRGDWGGAWEAIKKTVANIVPGIKQVIGGMFDYLKGLGKIALDAALGIGGSIVDGIKNGIQNKWSAVMSWVTEQINKIPLAIRKLLGIASPSKVMKTIGGDVVAGLVVGLTERAAEVHAAIAAIASGLIDAARGALDSHSPSRAFADIGGDVVAGLDDGLAGMRDSAARLASDVSGGVGGAADAAITAAARFAEIGDISVTIDAQPLMQAVDGMKQAAGDLRQSLLDLQPVATDTGVDIGTLASGANIISMFEQLASNGVALVPALASIGATAVGAAGSGGLGALAAALTGPVALAIGGAIAIGVLLYKAWETNFGGIRDKVLEVTAIVQAKWTEVRAKLGAVFGEIWADLKPLRDRFTETWQSIQEKVSAVVSWISDNVKSLIESAFNGVMAALDGFITFWRANGDSIIAIVTGLWDTVTGIFSAAWAVLSGVVRAGIALLHGDFSGAGKILADTVRGWWAGVKQAFGGLAQAFGGVGAIIKTSIVDPMLNIGAQIVAGIQSGVMSAWNGMKTWLANKFADLPLIAKKVLGIASPSREFAEIGENVVAGMEQGLLGIKQIGDFIQREMVNWVKDKDLENFGSIATLTGNLVDIFENTTKALKSLLSFDVSTSAAQISAQFKALVGTFQTALLEMKTLAQYAGRGAPKEKEIADAFLNFFDIQNIELVSKGFEATISLINGLLDIAAKLQTVKVPSASDIEALLEPMSKLGDVAARFIHSVGKPEGEDATAYFQNGANTTAALASWAKSIADIVGIKFGAVSAEFASQMEAAAGAAADAWAAVKDTALAWGQIQSTTREQLITGIQAYATAVGAAVGLLKATAELKIDVATLATADQMKLAAEVSKNAVASVAEVAKDWLGGAKWIENAVAGIKAYAEAAGAAVSLLKAAADLDLSKMVAATDDQLHKAADVSLKALGELGRVAAAFVSMGAEARTALVQAVKDYAEAAGAAVGLLGGAAALDFTKAVAVEGRQLHDAADATLAALGELQRVAAGFVTMGHEATGPLVQSIKDFAEGAGAAVDLLVKGAQGMNALGEIKRLSGIQPRLIRTILKQLRDVVDIVTDPKNAPKTPTEEQLAALKSLGDSSGVFDGIVKAAAGMNELGQVKRLSGVQPRLIRTVLTQLSTVIGIVTDPKTALKPITSEQAAAIKAIGDSSGVLSSLSSVADGFAKMSGKLSIPSDLSERVTTLIDAMRTVVNGIAGAMTGEGAINLKDAVAGADIAEAVGRIGDAFGPIFDAINAAIESPFGRIKATGQRGDTFRQNIANRIKASLVAAVTALSDALGSMPTITIPDGLSEQIDKLAGIYDRILDVIGKLDGVKIDTRAVASLAAALGVLAGGVGGVGAGNISVTGGGSNLSIASGPGGGIVINNEFNPTLTPLPITINTTNNITVGAKVVDAIATEVQQLQELKLRQGGTP